MNILIMTKSSPYVKPSIRKANELENKIILIQDTLEQWIKCQRSWMYLEPIFSSEDIKKKMQLESSKFEEVNKNWIIFMENFQAYPSLWEVYYKINIEKKNNLLCKIN